uniref:Chlororespiratory reduction 21 n=1 Tax=Kalanchoe fedtschenkoi TaxID=63787 RepID=A0A7N0UFS5_KALFE
MQLFRSTSKIAALAKLGQVDAARKLFDEMPQRDTVAHNAMLSGYSRTGCYKDCLSLFDVMRFSGMEPDPFSFTAVLSAASGLPDLRIGRKIHGLVLVSGYGSWLPVGNSLIDLYGKCLSADGANRVFEEMRVKNVISWCSLLFAHTNCGQFGDAYDVFDVMEERVEIAWNIMIAGHARFGEFVRCLGLFKEMRDGLCKPDQWTYSALMNACAEAQDPNCGRMMHGVMIKDGWSSAVEAYNSLLSFYAKFYIHSDVLKLFAVRQNLSQVSWNAIIDAYMKEGDMENALLLFHQAPDKNVVLWTSMISGYMHNGLGERALDLFINMISCGLQPDVFTFGAVLHACANLAVMRYGTMIHGCVLSLGYSSHTYAGNGLINMYAKCGDIVASSRSFDDIQAKDLVSWNAMLFSYGLQGQAAEALKFYERMLVSGIKPDKVTFIGLLMTCSHMGLIENGHTIFNSMPSFGIAHEMDHISIMVDMLGRGGYLDEAEELRKTLHLQASTSSSSTDAEALLSACSAQGNMLMGSKLGKGLQLVKPGHDMSYVLLSNLYCLNGHWKEAEMVREAMAVQGVKKLPGYSWVEIDDRIITFVAGDNFLPFIGELSNILISLTLQMRSKAQLTGKINIKLGGIGCRID